MDKLFNFKVFSNKIIYMKVTFLWNIKLVNFLKVIMEWNLKSTY